MAAASAVLMVATIAPTRTSAASDRQPYAGLEQREIKALSSGDIDDYRNGRGMSLALAAELNGYPGPRHVLDLSEPLGLTAEQRAQAQALFDGMQKEAVALGELIVEREAELDALFANSVPEADRVEALTASVGRLNGQLRFAHLQAHLAMRALLSPAQIEAYASLRGYRPEQAGTGHHGHR